MPFIFTDVERAMQNKSQVVRAGLQQYVKNPQNYPLRNYNAQIDEFIQYAADNKKTTEITLDDDIRQVYRVAVINADIEAIQTLNKLLTIKQRRETLLAKEDISPFARLRGVISPHQTSQCVTPVHMAIKLMREKNETSAVYDALLKDLPPHLKVEVLTAVDEKCRDAILLAGDTKKKTKRRELLTKVTQDLETAQQQSDGK